MPRFVLEVVGGREVATGIREALKRLEDPAPQKALDIVLRAAQSRSPVRTGFLRASGYTGSSIVGFSAYYAYPVHWGTRRMPARPFLSNAVTATGDAWVKCYEDDVQLSLDKIKGA